MQELSSQGEIATLEQWGNIPWFKLLVGVTVRSVPRQKLLTDKIFPSKGQTQTHVTAVRLLHSTKSQEYLFLPVFRGPQQSGVRGGKSPKPIQFLPVAVGWKASSFAAQHPPLQNGIISLFILRKALPDANRCYKGLEMFLLALKSKLIPYDWLLHPKSLLEKAVLLHVGAILNYGLWSLPLYRTY